MPRDTRQFHHRASLVIAFAVIAELIGTAASADVRFQAPVLAQLGHGAPAALVPQRWEIAFGDLDGDGRVDVVSPLLDSVAIYLGQGDGTFKAPLRFPLPGRTDHPAVADFDGDGALDIAWGGSHRVGILFGDGTAQNWTPVTLATSDDWSAVLAGDFDGDGRADLVSTSIDATGTKWLRTYLSRPGRAFEVHSEAQPAAWPYPMSFRACDVNEDGLSDFVIGGTGSFAADVWTSDGDGTFTRSASVPAWAWGVDVGDVTGDGHADLVIAESSPSLQLVHGRGDGTFGPAQFLTTPGASSTVDVEIGDLTGDGIPDLAYSSRELPTCGTRVGLGGGAFAPGRGLPTGSAWNPIALIDLDGDERLDFVGLTFDALVSALGDGEGGFRRSATQLTSTSFANATGGDLNLDGIMDLIFVNNAGPQTTLQVALGRPGHSFDLLAPMALPGMTGDLHVADMDEDGAPDVLAGLQGEQVALFRGRTDGTLDSARVRAAPGDGFLTALGDVTGDGHLDLVYGVGTLVRVLQGDGAGGFGSTIDSPLTPAGAPIYKLVLGDSNGDGHLDVGVSAGSSGGPNYLYRGIGDGSSTFAPEQLSSPGEYPVVPNLAFGDVNGDHRDDCVTFAYACGSCYWTGLLTTRLQQPTGTLSPGMYSLGTRWLGVVLLDVDGDGARDAIVTTASGPMIKFNDGSGRFGRPEGYGGSGLSALAIGDFDGDGRLDLCTGSSWQQASSGLIVYYGRESVPPAVALLAPTPGAPYGIGSKVLIQWQAHDDVTMGSIDLFVSRRGRRGPFEPIAMNLPNSGGYFWTVTGPASDSVAFKVVARDSADNVGWVVSDSLTRIAETVSVGDPFVESAMRTVILSIIPNPVHDRMRIAFTLRKRGRATLTLHDLSGRRVAVLAVRQWPAGRSVLDANTFDSGSRLAPGLFFLRLNAGGVTSVTRITLLR